MKDRYKLLIFDWDGTLIDSVGLIVRSLQDAAEKTGFDLPTDKQARSVIGLSLELAMRTLFPQASARDISRLILAYQAHYNLEPLGREALFDGVPEMLDELRSAGYKLAVATGKSRQGLDHALDSTGARSCFHATRAAGETASKPNPLMLHQILTELAVNPDQALMIGDSVHDMQMARNAQMETVGVFCGADLEEDLLVYQPALGLSRTADLLPYFT